MTSQFLQVAVWWMIRLINQLINELTSTTPSGCSVVDDTVYWLTSDCDLPFKATINQHNVFTLYNVLCRYLSHTNSAVQVSTTFTFTFTFTFTSFYFVIKIRAEI
jgi:hypothetical protein